MINSDVLNDKLKTIRNASDFLRKYLLSDYPYDKYLRPRVEKLRVIIPCSGSGERFKPISEHVNKCLVTNPVTSNADTLLTSHILSIDSVATLYGSNSASNGNMPRRKDIEYVIVVSSKEVYDSIAYEVSIIEGLAPDIRITTKLVNPLDIKTNADTVRAGLEVANDSTDTLTRKSVLIIDPTVTSNNLVATYSRLLLSYYDSNNYEVSDTRKPAMIASTRPTDGTEYYMMALSETDVVGSVRNYEGLVYTRISTKKDLAKPEKSLGYSVSIAIMPSELADSIITITEDTKYWDDMLYNGTTSMRIVTDYLYEFDTVDEYINILSELADKNMLSSYTIRTIESKWKGYLNNAK